jgi:hypothetical protein
MGAANQGQHPGCWQLYVLLSVSAVARSLLVLIGSNASRGAGKNHICLDSHYVECNFDNSTIIAGTWIDGGKELNVTGADPDVCPKAPALPIPAPWYLWQNGSAPSCPGGCGQNVSQANGTVVCMKETDMGQSVVADSFCMGSNGTKPSPLTRQCPASAPCLPGPSCFASGGGWTGFDSAGPAGCGLGGKTNMDGGSQKGVHTCECKTASGSWEAQTRGSTQDANDCKNHICLDASYTSCRFDKWTIITGTWNTQWKELNVTGADPKVCPKAPPLPKAARRVVAA